jgi:hypothetical protein
MNSAPPTPVLIDETSLSRAWARAFLQTIDSSGKEIAPLIISITGFSDQGIATEDYAVRTSLDAVLAEMEFTDIETVAFTIFPQCYWELSEGNRERFYATCIDAAPRLQAMNRRRNGRGIYFERLMRYGRGPFDGNQLEWIISEYNRRDGVRRSMLQATTFDPGRDHVATAQLGFPCLQQVSFVPTASGLVVNAFYATQQLFDKAYGNYLGITRLGAFMAQEMGLRLSRVNIIVGVAKLERVTKGDRRLKRLLDDARQCIRSVEAPRARNGNAPAANISP